MATSNVMKNATAHMYFVAIVCPPDLNEKVLRFKHWMKDQFGCSVALRSPAHITLVPPFWQEDAALPSPVQVLRSFEYDGKELSIQTAGFSHFGKRVLFIAVGKDPALQDLKDQAEQHFIHSFKQVKREDRPFHPHITIANRDMRPSHFDIAWEHFSKMKVDDSFFTGKLSLLKLNPGKWDVVEEKTW